MCRASVEPMPSSISVPKRPVKRRYTSAGRVSPAVTVRPDRRQGGLGQAGVDHGGTEARWGEEQGGPVASEQLGGPGRAGRIGIEHGAGPDAKREEQGVAEPEGEEQLRHRVAHVVGSDVEDRAGVGVAHRLDVAVAVDGGLRACRSCPRCRATSRRCLAGGAAPPATSAASVKSSRRWTARPGPEPAAPVAGVRRRRWRPRPLASTAPRWRHLCSRPSMPAGRHHDRGLRVGDQGGDLWARSIVDTGTGMAPMRRRGEEGGREGQLVADHHQDPVAGRDSEGAQPVGRRPGGLAAARRR